MDGLWYLLNGLLALLYLLAARLPTLIAGGALLLLARGAERHVRPWLQGGVLLAYAATLIAVPPIPLLLALTAVLALAAVKLDRFAPDTLRWRAAGGHALYAAAAIGYSLYTGYLQHLQIQAGTGSAHLSLLSQGQGYVQLIGAIGLLVVLPLGLGTLLVQGLLVHKPVQRSVADTVAVVTSARPPRAGRGP